MLGLGVKVWSQELYTALIHWLSALRWPPPNTAGGGRGVSWHQLAIDFECWSGIDLPPTKQGATIGERARVIGGAVKRIGEMLGRGVYPGEAVKRGNALLCFGFPRAAGLARRPVLAGGAETRVALRDLADAAQLPSHRKALGKGKASGNWSAQFTPVYANGEGRAERRRRWTRTRPATDAPT